MQVFIGRFYIRNSRRIMGEVAYLVAAIVSYYSLQPLEIGN